MRFRNTLIALVVLAGLTGLIYVEYRVEMGREEDEAARNKVFAFETADATGLDLIRGEAVLSLRKGEGEEEPQWRLTEPLHARADEDEVAALLFTLSKLLVTGRLEVGDEDPGQYGLAAPTLQIVLHPGAGRPPIELSVGDRAPIGSTRYARGGGDNAILSISSSVSRLMDISTDQVRYRRVVDIDSWNVTRFELESEGETVSFGKADGDWRIMSPVEFPAENTRVESLLYDLTSLKAEGFAPADLPAGRLGLNLPDLVLRILPEEGEPAKVAIGFGGDEGGIWARRADMPEIFRLGDSFRDKIEVDLEQYRDGRVAPVERRAISELRAVTAGGEKVLVRDGDFNWRWGSLEGATVPATGVEEFLDSLEAVRALSFREGAAAGGGIGTAAVPFDLSVRAGNRTPVQVKVGRQASGRYLVSSTASSAIYEVGSELIDDLVEKTGALQPPPAAAAAGHNGANDGGTTS
jgi:hypothetical protein